MYNLMLCSHQEEYCLGILVPEGEWFCLTKRVPLKYAGTENAEFELRPRHKKMDETFVPIRAEEPFAYLKYLGECILSVRNGMPGIILPNEK